ncbi:MAG: hypothetical protein IJ527_00390 [Prevotella sp.]|nr:hypothetical protein [Prevotella sp.]
MTYRPNISTSISGLAISLLLLLTATGTTKAQKIFTLEEDSIPLFRGFQVSFDVAGAAQLALSDYGQYEAALRLNLHDQWFPIVEAGLGKARHDDEVTGIYYKTSAPYFRVGVDINLLKNKHADNRLYGGLRYAFTSYKVDIARNDFPDPVWQWDTGFGVHDVQCSHHWVEAVVGIDAKIAGPLHLGWSVRYKRRLFHNEGDIGQTWYVPGYGTYSDTKLGATFNVIIDI